jgi:transposase-like protein
MPTPRSRLWFYEFRPTGPRAAESAALHHQVLDLWATGLSKAEIASMLDIDPHTVRRITWRARKAGDARGFAKTTPVFANASHSVQKIYQEQYVIRGLARALEIPHARVEAALRDIAKEMETEGK